MKVKLLKKIRKRYSIERIDKLESNPNTWVKDSFDYCDNKLPFYILTDKRDVFGLHFRASKCMGDLVNSIRYQVREEYKEYSVKAKTKRVSTKVWYNQNI